MRMLLVAILALGFVLLDVVVIIALSNVVGWLSVASDTLFLMLLVAVIGMVIGLVGLRWHHRATLKG